MDFSVAGEITSQFWQSILHLPVEAVLANKIARAIGMAILVLVTIWVIALVYNGYAQDSERAIGLRVHPNKKLGEGDILFDQSIYPIQMDGVEAVGQVFYVYDSADKREKRPRRIPLTKKVHLKLHVRVSPLPKKEGEMHYGCEYEGALSDLDQLSVTYPTPETNEEPSEILATPNTVREYIEQYKLVDQWTADDAVPIISLGEDQLQEISEARAAHILERATAWKNSRQPGLLNRLTTSNAVRQRANMFGSYYIKLQFSKRPDFVLFRHPNKELKMTAWLTVLTSLFSVAMDLWPVESSAAGRRAASPAAIERPALPPSSIR